MDDPSPPREKNLVDLLVDFVCGALLGLLIFNFFSHPGRRQHDLWRLHFDSYGWALYHMGGALLTGALTALWRRRYPAPEIFAPRAETPSLRSRVILWVVAALGVGCMALAFGRA